MHKITSRTLIYSAICEQFRVLVNGGHSSLKLSKVQILKYLKTRMTILYIVNQGEKIKVLVKAVLRNLHFRNR